MAKITRYSGNVQPFGANATGTNRTVFGDVTKSDTLDGNVTADFLKGWEIVGPNDFPTLEDFNAMGFTLGQYIAYLHQMGVPEWNVAQEYHSGSMCVYSGKLYRSKVDSNIGNTPPASSDANWVSYSDSSESVLLSGDQTIDDVKTFTSSPIVPEATVGNQAVNFLQFINSVGIPLPTKVAYNQIDVNGTILTLASPVAGTDYYFSLSAITTTIQPDTIGGFHYGLIPVGETPTGNKTAADIAAIAGINRYSIWTKWFRPSCDPRGMVHINGRWYDIYLSDSRYGIRKYSAPTSKTGFAIAGGETTNGRQIPLIPLEFGGNGTTTYGKYTWFQAGELAKAAGKEKISYNDFPTIAYGVQEQVDASSQDGGVGNITHFANLTSKWGIEQATGTQWIWGSDVGGNRDEGSTTWAWRTGLTDNRGNIYALHPNHITAVLLGANRGGGVDAGSRASNWSTSVWDSLWDFGSRFSCDHRMLV